MIGAARLAKATLAMTAAAPLNAAYNALKHLRNRNPDVLQDAAY